ncbi:MAG: hypothetical protein KatS3mg131_2635 [Candidatus Tectimicrobiota bacterium]|nr:MAG: hypothetical protein KatS3mg131_2635 [Candidatus Tectomicrobia bacterium]
MQRQARIAAVLLLLLVLLAGCGTSEAPGNGASPSAGAAPTSSPASLQRLTLRITGMS